MPDTRASRANDLARAIKVFRPALVPTIIFSVIINLLAFVSPLYMLQVYDRVLSSRSIPSLLTITAIAVFLLLLLGVFEFVRARVLARTGVQFDEVISQPLFRIVATGGQQLPLGARIQILRDADQVRDFVTGSGLVMLMDAPWAPLFILLCWVLHPLLGLTTLIGAVCVFGFAVLNDRLTRRGQNRASNQASNAHQFAVSALESPETIRSLGMIPAMMGRWRDVREDSLLRQVGIGDVASAVVSTSKVFRLVLQTAIMGVGAWLVIEGKISGGSIFAASMLMGRALGPVEQVVANWKPLLEARAAYARLNDLFAENEAPSISMGLPSPRGHVTVENISVVNRESGQTLLRNVSFGAEPGTVLAVAGHSGAGKSTLLRALVGAVLPDDGHVRMDGFSLRHWDPDRLGAHVGYLPQEITLYAGTVAENIARMGHPDSGKVLAAAEGAGLHQLIQRLPTGYDTRIGPGGLPLSGGFRQRIALARALYGDPCLLILDEPTAHLDTEGEQSVIKVMQACRARGATVVFSSHTNRLIAVADRALLLRDGQIQSLGNVEIHKGDMAVRPPMAVPTSNPQDMLHAAVRAVAL